MPTSDVEATWAELLHDCDKLGRPLFAKLAEQLQLEQATHGDVVVKFAVHPDKDTGDYTITVTAKYAASGAERSHKAQLSNRQLTLFEPAGV